MNRNKWIFTSLEFFSLMVIVLFSLSFDMYKKFNLQSSLNLIEKDQIYIDAEKILSDFEYEEIDHKQFINKLELSKNNEIQNTFVLTVLDNYSISYKVIDNNQKTINFGTITPDNPLKLDFNGDFSIDLSKINGILFLELCISAIKGFAAFVIIEQEKTPVS